jgi:hypothetical protein
MPRKVIILHLGALARYQIENIGAQRYHLTLTQYSGTRQTKPPTFIYLTREPTSHWSGDVGSRELLEDLGMGIFSGGNL